MKPNVVVVVLDALRADRVGALGGRDVTPNIDAIASDSVSFTNAFTTINTTSPALTSLHTGLYPLSHGVVNHGKHVTDEEKRAIENVRQLPEVLSAEGYCTGAFARPMGRWHKNGFERYPGVKTEDATEGNESLKRRVGSVLESIHPSLYDIVSTTYDANLRRFEDGTPKARGIEIEEDAPIREFEAFIDGGEPFYSLVHLMDTHIPYKADPDNVAEYLGRFDYDAKAFSETAWANEIALDIIPNEFHERVEDGEYPDVTEKFYYTDGTPTSAVLDAHYDAAAHETDERFGRVVEALEDREILDETLLIVLSDHGESLTEHGIYYDHHGLYDVSVQIPLFVRPPGGASGEVDGFVQITDLAPTVVDYADADNLKPDGESLVPVIEDGEPPDREFVMAEESQTQRRRMIRTEDEKLIYLLEGDTICRYCRIQHAHETELYDLEDDPTEEKNLYGDRPESVSKLREKAEEAAEAYEERRAEGSGEAIEYDDEEAVKRRLEDLGYK